MRTTETAGTANIPAPKEPARALQGLHLRWVASGIGASMSPCETAGHTHLALTYYPLPGADRHFMMGSREWGAGRGTELVPRLLHPLPLELRHLERPRGARQEAPRLERTPPGAAAADGVVPCAQLDSDRVPQPLGELTRAAAVHARRHHRELSGPDSADRVGATPARLEQPRDTAQRLDAIAPSVLTDAVGSDRYAGNRRIVPRGLQDQLAGAAPQAVRGVQTSHVVHQVPTRHTVPLDLDEHVAIEFAEQPGDVQRLPHQLPHTRAQRGEMVLTAGPGGHD